MLTFFKSNRQESSIFYYKFGFFTIMFGMYVALITASEPLAAINARGTLLTAIGCLFPSIAYRGT
jgi:hypothetical protein